MHPTTIKIPTTVNADLLAVLAIGRLTLQEFFERALVPVADRSPELSLEGAVSANGPGVEYRPFLSTDVVGAAWELARESSALSLRYTAMDVFTMAAQREISRLFRAYAARADDVAAVRRHQTRLAQTHSGHSAPRDIDAATRADLVAYNGLFAGLADPPVLFIPPSAEERVRREAAEAAAHAARPPARFDSDVAIDRAVADDAARTRSLLRVAAATR